MEKIKKNNLKKKENEGHREVPYHLVYVSPLYYD